MLSPGDRLGVYEVQSLVGKGGMGEVYRARDTKLHRDVALKVLGPAFVHDAERLARFQREAHLLASLNHPRIATLYGLEDSGSTHALVMEFVEGPTLADRIAQGPLEWEDARPIALQLAEALEYAHERNVVHRDIKPANIKVSADGAVKVLDFGLAKAMAGEGQPASDPSNSPTLTLTMATTAGAILGTAVYMAPEQAKGRTVDRRADIWAFGVVLYEMLSSRRMFGGEDAGDILASVIKENPSLDALPAETPRAVRRLIERCIEKDPKRRLQAIGEARIAIEDAVKAEAPVAATVSAMPPAQSKPWAWIAATAAAAIVSGVLVFIHLRENPPETQVLKYTVALPENSIARNVSVSPDGRMIAVELGRATNNPLWLRALDSLQSRMLPGTEGGAYPFWSPDNRYIGFFESGKLKKIAVAGGPAQALCDAADGRGGTWNSEGTILFAPFVGKPLQRVSASGGVPVDVTKPETNTSYRFPVFLPDGRRFLYLRGLGSENGIYLSSLDAKPEQAGERLLADESRPSYQPPSPGGSDGYVLFVRDGSAMAQPVDPKTMHVSGELFPVMERVVAGRNTNNPLLSVSKGGVLSYSSAASVVKTQLSWVDRSGKELQGIGEPGSAFGLALSPDGKRAMLTVAANDPQRTDLWIRELDRNTLSRFSLDQGSNTPVWSPDGTRVAYYSRVNKVGIYLRASNGAGQGELLWEQAAGAFPSDWTNDGRYLIFTMFGGTVGSSDVMALSMSSGAQGSAKPIPLVNTRFGESDGRVSPDGHWLAYDSNDSGQREVYVRPFLPEAVSSGPASGKWQISSGGDFPSWSRDGKELFYISLDRKLMSVDVQSNGASFSRGTPKELFSIPFPGALLLPTPNYAVSPDGKRFLVAAAVGESEQPPLTVVVNWLEGLKK